LVSFSVIGMSKELGRMVGVEESLAMLDALGRGSGSVTMKEGI
jgi:hypothetical protein